MSKMGASNNTFMNQDAPPVWTISYGSNSISVILTEYDSGTISSDTWVGHTQAYSWSRASIWVLEVNRCCESSQHYHDMLMRSRRVRSSIKWWVELLSSDCWMSNRFNQKESQPDRTRQRSGRCSGSSSTRVKGGIAWRHYLKKLNWSWYSAFENSWVFILSDRWQSYQRLIVYLHWRHQFQR
jgi:hypothetical protein